MQLGVSSTVQSQHRVMQLGSSSFIFAMFNSLSNCTMDISPQQLNVNLHPKQPQNQVDDSLDEFDRLVNSVAADFP